MPRGSGDGAVVITLLPLVFQVLFKTIVVAVTMSSV